MLLSYGALNYYFFVGAIGVHEGQLYVEIQTELDHSDIHVLDLDEDEGGVGQSFICPPRAWTIGELNFIPYL